MNAQLDSFRNSEITYATARQDSYSLPLSGKGQCWYCSRSIGTVGRFCNRDCAEAFENDESALERLLVRAAA